MYKIHFTFDKSHKAENFKRILLNKYFNYSPNKCDVILVAGGDGYMLKTLKRYYKYQKPFYGVNCGSYGFLMNNYNLKNLFEKIKKSKQTIINPLILKTKIKNVTKKIIAINEISLFRQSRQTASLSLKIGKKMILKNLIGDGVMVSTPAGSTAYNMSVHGPILSLNSKKISIAPISAFRPRRWRGKIVSDKSKIIIKNLNPKKRPISAVADNIEVRNARTIHIKINHKIRFNLLYDKNRSLQKKIKLEQLRKET